MKIICRRAVLEGSGASGDQRFTGKVRLLVDERACTSVGEQESLSKANSLYLLAQHKTGQAHGHRHTAQMADSMRCRFARRFVMAESPSVDD